MLRWITIDRIWLLLPPILTLVYVGTMVQYPLDFWHHAVAGRLIASSGSIPDHDTFTYTIAGQPVVYQSWLAAWAMYDQFHRGGFALVQFVAALCYAAAIAVTTAHAWQRCKNARVSAFLALLALALSVSNLGIRTQAVSFLLFAIELFLLWQCSTRWWIVPAVGVLEAIWANTHGAFPLGVVLPSLFLLARAWDLARTKRPEKIGWKKTLLADRPIRILTASVAASLVGLFCNPHPSKILPYVFNLTSRAAERGIGEWQPVEFLSFTGIFFLASIFSAIALVFINRKKLQTIELLLLLTFGLLALGAHRMLVWWAMVLPPALAPHLAALLQRRGIVQAASRRFLCGIVQAASRRFMPQSNSACLPHEKRQDAASTTPCPKNLQFLNAAVLLAILCLAALSTPWTKAYNPLLSPEKRRERPKDEPWEAVQFLEERGCRGRVFHPMKWGAYLSWHFDPEMKVFIDGRVDFFPDQIWNEYVALSNAEPGWQNLLDRYQVDLILWNPKVSHRLPAALDRSTDWKKIYEDHLTVIYQRMKHKTETSS